MADEGARQREWDDLDAGLGVRSILQRRVEQAQVEHDAAVAELRAVSSDGQVLAEFGIDLGQA